MVTKKPFGFTLMFLHLICSMYMQGCHTLLRLDCLYLPCVWINNRVQDIWGIPQHTLVYTLHYSGGKIGGQGALDRSPPTFKIGGAVPPQFYLCYMQSIPRPHYFAYKCSQRRIRGIPGVKAKFHPPPPLFGSCLHPRGLASSYIIREYQTDL